MTLLLKLPPFNCKKETVDKGVYRNYDGISIQLIGNYRYVSVVIFSLIKEVSQFNYRSSIATVNVWPFCKQSTQLAGELLRMLPQSRITPKENQTHSTAS